MRGCPRSMVSLIVKYSWSWLTHFMIMQSNLLHLTGHAMIVFPEYISTFDGLSFKLGLPSAIMGSCSYVLVADLVDANFSVALEVQRSQNKTIHNIFVTAGHNTIVIDLEQKVTCKYFCACKCLWKFYRFCKLYIALSESQNVFFLLKSIRKDS